MKNPFMSAWLSAANKAAGSARGLWSAAAKRQQTAAIRGMTKSMFGAGKKRAPSKRGKS